MNINALRDQDTAYPSFYLTGCGATSAWPGMLLYVSKDGGTTWDKLASSNTPATMGTCVTALGNWTRGIDVVDYMNTVQVSLYRGSLSSVSFDQFLLGANAAVIGGEIVFFQNAALQGDGSYILSTLLRARRGSDYFMDQHVVSERFVLVNTAAFTRVDMIFGDIGNTYQYKAVTRGLSLEDTQAQTFLFEGANLKPYSGCNAYADRDAVGAITIYWTRRNKSQGDWINNVDVPMTEASESYQIDVFTDSTYSTVMRTLTSSTSSVGYSAANQVSDFGSVQSTIYIKIYQMSAAVGRGYPLKVSV